jgi:hypothetical protein
VRLAVATGTPPCAVLLVLACGGGAGGQGSGTPATDLGAYAQGFCDLLEPCCADAGLGTGGVFCNAWIQSQASKGGYDPASGQACLQALQQEPGATFCASLTGGVPACSTVFGAGGAVQPGQPCKQDGDCAVVLGGGATCYKQDAFVDGGAAQTQTCVQTTPGKAGDGPCIGDVESAAVTVYGWSGQGPPPGQAYVCSLADGLTCSDATQQCTAQVDVGGACSTDTDCVATAYCADSGSSGQCVARLADGASCTAAPTGCLATSYCDASSDACTPFVAPGSPCSADPQCQYGCSGGACNQGGTGSVSLAGLCGT